MPTGLQIFDASGAVVLDTTHRISRLLGTVTTTAGQAGSITVPGFSQGTPWAVVQAVDLPFWSYTQVSHPVAQPTITGNVLSWSQYQRGTTIFYGVY